MDYIDKIRQTTDYYVVTDITYTLPSVPQTLGSYGQGLYLYPSTSLAVKNARHFVANYTKNRNRIFCYAKYSLNLPINAKSKQTFAIGIKLLNNTISYTEIDKNQWLLGIQNMQNQASLCFPNYDAIIGAIDQPRLQSRLWGTLKILYTGELHSWAKNVAHFKKSLTLKQNTPYCIYIKDEASLLKILNYNNIVKCFGYRYLSKKIH